MPRIGTIFFDAGNTLFDLKEAGLSPERVRGKIYADVARRYGNDVSDDEMTKHMTEIVRAMPQRIDGAYRYSVKWFRIFIDRLFERLGGVSDARLATQELFTYFRDDGNFFVFDDVSPVLEELRKRGYRMGIISNWSPTLPMVLYNLGLLEFFKCVVVSATVELEKPGKAIFDKALECTGAAPGMALHVGDSFKHDYQGAGDAGLKALLLDRPGDSPHADEVGDDRIRSLTELSGILAHAAE
ncbi:MAG: HAD family hydrolase [Planctomycetota bacterium]|nr:MAG: HAD family hydrolase [Planctomycetota bacterium]